MDKYNKSNVDKIKTAAEKTNKVPYLKYGLIAFAAVVVIAVAAIIFFSVSQSYVASVGSEKIGVGEFKYYLEYQKNSMLQEAQKADANTTAAAFWKTNINGENAFEVAKKKTLDSMRDLKIQLIKAKEAGTKLDSTDKSYIDQQINSIITNTGSGSRTKANTELKKQGLSLDTFTKMYQDILMAQKFRSAEYKKLNLTNADIKTYYEKNPDWYKESQYRANGEEAVWVRHILINVSSTATQADKDAAKKKAEDILAKAKAGEDFATLAKSNSDDTGSKDNGGEYVFGISSGMVQEFKDAAFALKPGEISGLVQTSYGYHIIKLEEKYAKDEPVSLKCATDYNEYGLNYIEYKLYSKKLDEWKKDPKFDIKKNTSIYNSIKYAE